MTNRKAPESVMRDLCEAVSQYMGGNSEWAFSTQIGEALKAYRAATAPLRTRAEVDAELGIIVRGCVEDEWAGEDNFEKWEKVTMLCREPTREASGSPSTAKESTDEVDGGAAYSEDERPCGCEETEGLKRRLADIRTEYEFWLGHKKSDRAALSVIGLLLRGA